MKSFFRTKQLLSLFICLVIVSSLAIVKHGELLGHSFRSEQKPQAANNDTLRILGNGTAVINTSALASDITGYGGKVPLNIVIKNGVVENIVALKNDETKEFFDNASALFEKWKGRTIDEAMNMKVDAVTGATFSSKAIIGNMQRGLLYAKNNLQTDESGKGNSSWVSSDNSGSSLFSLRNITGICVVLMAAILPLFVKNRRYHFCQLILNVIVLGFWCGTCLSYSSLLGFAAHGMEISGNIIATVMLITAFIYPLFGKKSHYCTHVCPYGSLQQIAGRGMKYKIRMSPRTTKRLDKLRKLIWALLMICIWGGVWSEWTDYEPFSAFIFRSASWIVIATALLFIALSFVITRPYCRFVCPMGTLIKLSQTSISPHSGIRPSHNSASCPSESTSSPASGSQASAR